MYYGLDLPLAYTGVNESNSSEVNEVTLVQVR